MPANDLEKRRPLRRQPNDHNFGSLIVLARDRRRISAGDLGCDNHGDPALPKESETLRLEYLCN
jgi:hypothetical protein